VRAVRRLLLLAFLLASSIAHADVDIAAGVASMSASLDDGSQGDDTGPMLAFDGGVHLAPWLSLGGLATFALYRNSDAVDGMRKVVTFAAGPDARLHWRRAFLGLGGGIELWHASFDDPGAPRSWFPGGMARVELGVTSEPMTRCVRAMIAARFEEAWFPQAPVDSAFSTSGSMATFEVVAGVEL